MCYLKGMAVIEYDTPFEALNAVSMFNKQQLLDREMTVRFDTKPLTREEERERERAKSSSAREKLPSGLRSIGNSLGGLNNLLGATGGANPLPLGGLGLNPLASAMGQPSAVSSNVLTLGTLSALAGLNTAGASGDLGNGFVLSQQPSS